MEKKTKREFTDEECLAIIKCCASGDTDCTCCPAYIEDGSCCSAFVDASERLVGMYEEKCKQLEESEKEYHEVYGKFYEQVDITDHLYEEIKMLKGMLDEKDALVRSHRDQYIKSREECDKLHKEIRRLEAALQLERVGRAMDKASVSAKEASANTIALEYATKVAALEEEVAILTKERDMNAKTCEMLDGRVSKLLEELEVFKQENHDQAVIVTDLNAQVKSLSDLLAKLENENKKLEEELDNRSADYGKVYREANFWEHRYEAMKQDYDACKAANETLKEKVAKYMREEKNSFDEIKEKLKNSEIVPIDPVSSSCTDTLELMKMADFWKGQYEATKKVLDETKVQYNEALCERVHIQLCKERAREYYEKRLKEKPKEIADTIIGIINEPFMYRFKWNAKRYTEKDAVRIVDAVLAEFREGLINSIKMEEFYGK